MQGDIIISILSQNEERNEWLTDWLEGKKETHRNVLAYFSNAAGAQRNKSVVLFSFWTPPIAENE